MNHEMVQNPALNEAPLLSSFEPDYNIPHLPVIDALVRLAQEKSAPVWRSACRRVFRTPENFSRSKNRPSIGR
jgi:hypothetical protein